MQLPRRVRSLLSMLGVLATAFSAVRGLVLFLESFSIVSSQYAADRQLLRICEESGSIGSDKLAAACSAARADSASPLILRAALRAASTALHETLDLASSPMKFVCLLFLMLSFSGSPVVKTMFSRTRTRMSDMRARLRIGHRTNGHESSDEDDHESDDTPVVMIMGDRRSPAPSAVTRRLRHREP